MEVDWRKIALVIELGGCAIGILACGTRPDVQFSITPPPPQSGMRDTTTFDVRLLGGTAIKDVGVEIIEGPVEDAWANQVGPGDVQFTLRPKPSSEGVAKIRVTGTGCQTDLLGSEVCETGAQEVDVFVDTKPTVCEQTTEPRYVGDVYTVQVQCDGPGMIKNGQITRIADDGSASISVDPQSGKEQFSVTDPAGNESAFAIGMEGAAAPLLQNMRIAIQDGALVIRGECLTNLEGEPCIVDVDGKKTQVASGQFTLVDPLAVIRPGINQARVSACTPADRCTPASDLQIDYVPFRLVTSVTDATNPSRVTVKVEYTDPQGTLVRDSLRVTGQRFPLEELKSIFHDEFICGVKKDNQELLVDRVTCTVTSHGNVRLTFFVSDKFGNKYEQELIVERPSVANAWWFQLLVITTALVGAAAILKGGVAVGRRIGEIRKKGEPGRRQRKATREADERRRAEEQRQETARKKAELKGKVLAADHELSWAERGQIIVTVNQLKNDQRAALMEEVVGQVESAILGARTRDDFLHIGVLVDNLIYLCRGREEDIARHRETRERIGLYIVYRQALVDIQKRIEDSDFRSAYDELENVEARYQDSMPTALTRQRDGLRRQFEIKYGRAVVQTIEKNLSGQALSDQERTWIELLGLVYRKQADHWFWKTAKKISYKVTREGVERKTSIYDELLDLPGILTTQTARVVRTREQRRLNWARLETIISLLTTFYNHLPTDHWFWRQLQSRSIEVDRHLQRGLMEIACVGYILDLGGHIGSWTLLRAKFGISQQELERILREWNL